MEIFLLCYEILYQQHWNAMKHPWTSFVIKRRRCNKEKNLRILKNCFKCFYFYSYFLFCVENNCKIMFKSRIEFRVLQVGHITNKLSYSSPLKARLGKHFLDENVKSVSIAFPPPPPQWRVKQSDRPTWSFEPDKNVIPENAARWRQANLFRNELPLIGRVGEVEGL